VAAEGHLGHLLPRSEAVVDRAAGETPLTELGVDATEKIRTEVGAGMARRLVDREVRGRRESGNDAAQTGAARTVASQSRPPVLARGAQRTPQVNRCVWIP
jgi:hypothetical protein